MSVQLVEGRPSAPEASPAKARSVVVLITDEDMFFATRRLIGSILRNWPEYPELVVFHSDLSSESVEFLDSVPRTRRVDLSVPGQMVGPAMHETLESKAELFYARFLIWGEAFDEYDRVLYLDVDGLVLNSLDPLLEQDFYTCVNGSGRMRVFRDPEDPDLQALLDADGIDLEGFKTCNGGVMLLSARWRTREQLAKITEIVRRYRPYLRWGDQSVTNLWMYQNGLRSSEDTRYNYLLFLDAWKPGARRLLREVGFLHFAAFRGSRRRLLMRLADRLTAIPVIGMDLFLGVYKAMFDRDYLRPRVRRALARMGRVRDRLKGRRS